MNRYLIPDDFVEKQDIAPITRSRKVPLLNCRVWDAPMTGIPTTPANDDLGLIAGTWGSAAPKITAGDVKTASSTRYTRFQVEVPDDFDEITKSLVLRVNCGMETTVAGTSCTIDAVVYEQNDGTLGSDICATAAQSMNSLTAADRDFVLTATNVLAGDLLDVRLAVAYVDAATETAVTPAIYEVALVYSSR